MPLISPSQPEEERHINDSYCYLDPHDQSNVKLVDLAQMFVDKIVHFNVVNLAHTVTCPGELQKEDLSPNLDMKK